MKSFWSIVLALAMPALAAAKPSLEQAKQESGVEFGELAGLPGARSESAVSAIGDGKTRAALTYNVKAFKERHGVPAPQDAAKKKLNLSPRGWLGAGLSGAGEMLGLLATVSLATSGPVGAAAVGLLAVWGALSFIEDSLMAHKTGKKELAKAAGVGFLRGAAFLPLAGEKLGQKVGDGIEAGIVKAGSGVKKAWKWATGPSPEDDGPGY